MKYRGQISKCKNMGDLFDMAKGITDRDDAKKFFNDYVDYIMLSNQQVTMTEAISIAHSNLGYYAGYYDDKVQLHIQKMYGSVHPIFGTIKPTSKEAFELGKKIGSSNKSARK